MFASVAMAQRAATSSAAASAAVGAPPSGADSAAAGAGAAREALAARKGRPPVCIVAVRDSLGGAAGHAFVAEGLATARASSRADSGAGHLSAELLGIYGRDTVHVSVQLMGDDGSGKTFWMNRMMYAFVRDTPGGALRMSTRGATYFADYDYVAEQSTRDAEHVARSRTPCLNGR